MVADCILRITHMVNPLVAEHEVPDNCPALCGKHRGKDGRRRKNRLRREKPRHRKDRVQHPLKDVVRDALKHVLTSVLSRNMFEHEPLIAYAQYHLSCRAALPLRSPFCEYETLIATSLPPPKGLSFLE